MNKSKIRKVRHDIYFFCMMMMFARFSRYITTYLLLLFGNEFPMPTVISRQPSAEYVCAAGCNSLFSDFENSLFSSKTGSMQNGGGRKKGLRFSFIRGTIAHEKQESRHGFKISSTRTLSRALLLLEAACSVVS